MPTTHTPGGLGRDGLDVGAPSFSSVRKGVQDQYGGLL